MMGYRPGPIANGPIGWTTGRFLLANRIVGASVGTALRDSVGAAVHLARRSGLGLAACGRSSRSQEPERPANTEYAFTMLLDLKIQRSCCITILMVLVA